MKLIFTYSSSITLCEFMPDKWVLDHPAEHWPMNGKRYLPVIEAIRWWLR